MLHFRSRYIAAISIRAWNGYTHTHTHTMIAVCHLFPLPGKDQSDTFQTLTFLSLRHHFLETQCHRTTTISAQSLNKVLWVQGSKQPPTLQHLTKLDVLIILHLHITAQLWAIAVKNQPRDTHELSTGCLQEHLGKKSHVGQNCRVKLAVKVDK